MQLPETENVVNLLKLVLKKKTCEITSGKFIFGGFSSLGTNVYQPPTGDHCRRICRYLPHDEQIIGLSYR